MLAWALNFATFTAWSETAHGNYRLRNELEFHREKKRRSRRTLGQVSWLFGDDLSKEAERLQNVCPKCQYHFYVSASDRIAQVLDTNTFEPWDEDLRPCDPLSFSDKKSYASKLVDEQKRTGLSDAALTGTGMIRARRVAIGVTDSAFIMGSMGSVVGERLTRLAERATAQSLPLIIISGSVGALGCMRAFFRSCKWPKCRQLCLATIVSVDSTFLCSPIPTMVAWRLASLPW